MGFTTAHACPVEDYREPDMEAIMNPVETLKKAGIKQVILSGVIGAAIGMIISFLVICTLVEISLSYFEAVLFGFILVLLGGFILGSFAVLVILSGLFCFALQEDWHKKMTIHQKVPIYFLLGTTFSFSIIFGMGDIVNICGTRCVGEDEVPVFHTNAQIYLVVIAAVVMGAAEGLIFGLLDAEDDVYLHDQFEKTRHLCIPLGGITGCIVGVLNQMFRHVQGDDSYHKVNQDDGRNDL